MAAAATLAVLVSGAGTASAASTVPGPASGSARLRVDTVPFKTYVKDVLPNEWLSGWKPAALQAGAVAAKQYAWY